MTGGRLGRDLTAARARPPRETGVCLATSSVRPRRRGRQENISYDISCIYVLPARRRRGSSTTRTRGSTSSVVPSVTCAVPSGGAIRRSAIDVRADAGVRVLRNLRDGEHEAAAQRVAVHDGVAVCGERHVRTVPRERLYRMVRNVIAELLVSRPAALPRPSCIASGTAQFSDPRLCLR